MILAIDPGPAESAYAVLDETNLKPLDFGKTKNEEVLIKIFAIGGHGNKLAIEMVASYGMAVGKEVFETVFWIGRFYQKALKEGYPITLIYRKEETMNLCHSMKAKDSNIIQALKDRFGNKGTKSNPGWFYGFSKDIWQAYAVGVTYADLYLKDCVKGDK